MVTNAITNGVSDAWTNSFSYAKADAIANSGTNDTFAKPIANTGSNAQPDARPEPIANLCFDSQSNCGTNAQSNTRADPIANTGSNAQSDTITESCTNAQSNTLSKSLARDSCSHFTGACCTMGTSRQRH